MVFKMAHLFNWEKCPQCPFFAKPRENRFSRLNFEVWELQNIVRLASALQVSPGGELVRKNSAGMSGYFMEIATRHKSDEESGSF